MRLSITGLSLAASLLGLCGCGGAPDTGTRDDAGAGAGAAGNAATPTAAIATPAPRATAIAARSSAAKEPLSCAAEIGAAAAARRVAVCRDVSPATRPPCNAANSCALIEDEIARSCALFEGRGASLAKCGSEPNSGEAAADVVRRYYSAINARDYATAWTQWGDTGRPGQSFDDFRAGFARTRDTRVTIGRLGPGEGGAGSIYQEVPVSVEATRDDGTRQRFTGRYVVRRVNGVDGATASQLRWHLASARLRPAD